VITRRLFLQAVPTLPSLLLTPPVVLPSYRQRAEALSQFIQENFWDAAAKRYRPAVPPDPNALPFDFMWANGIQFSALVGGMRYAPEHYRPLVDAFFEGLDAYFDRNANAPAYDAYFSSPGHSDKYYDDNAWMVLTFVEAYERTREQTFLERAATLQRFIYSGWDEKCGGGIYWRQDHTSKNTCSNAPTATAAVALSQHIATAYHLDWARRIVEWTNKTLQSPEGTFWDNIRISDNHIEQAKWTYNTALMLRANLGLYRATQEKAYLAEAKRLAEASVKEFINPETGAFRDDANFSHLLVEAFLDLYQEAKTPYLLESARCNGDFVYQHVRDTGDGGYFVQWRNEPHRDVRKTLMANASVARLFWLLVPYDTVTPEKKNPV
jgi:rhamnogalacturonyl hydrolase YesR